MEDPDTKQEDDKRLKDDGDSVPAIDGGNDPEYKVKLIEDAYEIQSFWYQNNISDLKSRLSSLKEICDNLVRECDNHLILSLKQRSDDDEKSKKLELKIEELSLLNSSLEEEKRVQTKLLAEKRAVIKKSYDDYSDLQKILQDTRKEYSENLRKTQDIEQQKMDMGFSLSLLEKEYGQLKKNNEWLWSQLDEKSNLLMKMQSDNDNELSKMKEELQNLKLEKDSSESKNGILQKLVEELENRVKNLLESNSENEGHFIVMKGQFQSEMDSMSRLCDMYSSDLKVSQKHVKSLEMKLSKTTSDMENLRIEHEKMSNNLTAKSEFWKSKFDEVYESNETLKLSINDKKPQSTPSEVHSFSILPGQKTYTELYIDYESEKEKRIAAERQIIIYENRINETIEYIKEKKEYIMDLEQEKIRAVSRNELLFKKLSQEIKDKKSILYEFEIIKEKNSCLESEQTIMKSDINDLIKQVRSLAVQLYRSYPTNILSVENYVGDLVSRYTSDESEDYSDIQKEIGENFVEVSNIEDIIRQSFMLRRFCKQLKVDFDKKKVNLENENESRFNNELNKKKMLLDETKNELESLENKYRCVLKQRNDLQEALRKHLKDHDVHSNTQISHAEDGSSVASNAETLVDSENPKDNQDKDQEDETFKRLYHDSVKQFDDYIKESGVSVKDLSEKLETMRTESINKSITIAKLNSQVGFQNEKYSLLLSGFETLKQDNLNLRDKIASLSLLASANEEKLQSLVDQLSSERVRAGHLEAKTIQMQSEKQVWQDSIERLSNEKKELYNERNRLNDELIELRFKFNDLLTSQKYEKRKYEDQVLESKEELNSLRKELASVKDEKYNILELKTAELKDANNKIAQLKVDYERLNNDLTLASQKETDLLAKLQDKTSIIAELDKQLSLYVTNGKEVDLCPDTPEAKIKKLECLLAATRKEALEKQEDIAALKSKESVLEELAKNAEKQLLEFNTTYEVYKESSQQTINNLETENKELKDSISSLNNEVKTLNETLREKEVILDTEKSVYEKEVSTLKSKIKILEESELKSSEFLEKAKSEMQVLKENLTSAQDRYEKEIMLHSSSLNTIQSLKVTLEQVNNKLSEKTKAISDLEEKLSLIENSSREVKDRLECDIKDLQKRNDDLVEQNSILHSQFSALERTIRPGILQSSDTSEDDKSKSITELRELVSLVQRDRDVVKAKMEVVRSENTRLMSEISHCRTLLDQERARFEAELQRNALRLRSESKHLEIMEKIEQNNILSESNATLRTRLEESNKKVDILSENMKNVVTESQELKGKVTEAQAEVDVLMKKNASLLEELSSYKGRVEQIMQRQKLVDPNDYENLKESLTQAEKKCADLLKERDETLESLTNVNNKNLQLALVAKRQKEALLSKAMSINEINADLKSKSEEIDSLQIQQKTLKDRLSEAESKLQQTIQKANATMLQFKDKNRSLLEERKSLELQISVLKAKIGAQQTGNEDVVAENDNEPVSPSTLLKNAEEHSPPKSPIKSEDPPSPPTTMTHQHPTPTDVNEPQQPVTSNSEVPPATSSQHHPDSAQKNTEESGLPLNYSPEQFQQSSPAVPKSRHTKEELDNLRLKYNDLLSQIEGSKMAGRLQYQHTTPQASDINWNTSQQKISKQLTEPGFFSEHQQSQQADNYFSAINDADMKMTSTEDNVAISKKMKSSQLRNDMNFESSNVFSPSLNTPHGVYQPPGALIQPHSLRSTQSDFPNANNFYLHGEQIEPGEISEFDNKYRHQNLQVNNTRTNTPARGSQGMDLLLHDVPLSTKLSVLCPDKISFSSPKALALPCYFQPGMNLKLVSPSKPGSTLTPHQRAQLLKRKLEAAEAEIAFPSTQSSPLPTAEHNITDHREHSQSDPQP